MAEIQSILPLNDLNNSLTSKINDSNIIVTQSSIKTPAENLTNGTHDKNDNNKKFENEQKETEAEQSLPLNITDELPLQFRWTLWYSAPRDIDSENKKWDQERVKQIVEFGTVEEFWRVFNNLAPPSSLQDGSDLHLFRGGVSPAWEDPFNNKGGTWTYRIAKDDVTHKIDSTWFNSVLTMIGDNFDDADDICGLVVSIRAKTNRVQLWIRHADDRDAVRRIGKQFKDINRVRQQTKIIFYSHDDQKDFAKPNKPSEMVL